MSNTVTMLRDLHRLHLRVRELRSEAEQAPRRIRKFQARIDLQQKQLQDAQDVLKHLKVTIHEKEVTMKANLDKITRHQEQMNKATTRREYDALRQEIDHEKQANRVLEDQILDTMGELEDKSKLVPDLEKSLQQARDEYRKCESEIGGRQSDLEKQLTEAAAALRAAEEALPADLKSAYERLVKSYGADCLSHLEGNSCAGCYTDATAQQYNDLRTGRVVFCKNCGRLLYLPE